MLLLITQMVFFQKIHMFLQLSCRALFGIKTAYLHIEKPKLQDIFLSKLTQFTQGNNVLEAAAYDTNGFLLRDTCVPSTQLNNPT
jgi:hypothetical protein